MVASDQGYPLWIADFQSQEEQESLNWVEASIDKVSHEHIAGLWTLTAYLEKLHQVVELTMNVSTDCDGRIYMLNIGFF